MHETVVVKPPALRQGSTICVVSPASPSLTTRYYDQGKAVLEGLGFRVKAGQHVNDRHLIFAGGAKARAEDINRAFADQAVEAIFCTRGGAGSLHTLPHIDFSIIRKNPKILMGYSDITALQIAIFNETGLMTFYGPMVASDMGKKLTGFTRESMLKVLRASDQPTDLINPAGKKVVAICPGTASGRLMGGCLSIVVAGLGTPHEIDARDKILFFEDIDEKPHRVDRYLTQLILAGKLEQAKGIIFGPFPKCRYYARDSYYKFNVSVLDIIRERIAPLGIPCIYGLQFGHVVNKLTIPQGAYANLDATKGQVTVEPSVV